jgi:hypothetical protein
MNLAPPDLSVTLPKFTEFGAPEGVLREGQGRGYLTIHVICIRIPVRKCPCSSVD